MSSAPARRRPRALAAAIVGVLVAAGSAGCLGQRDEDAARGAAAGAPALPDPGVVHVHGLGVDPASGVLYAATHSGLFEIPEDGPARRIADRYQDTMGFTVAGPGVLLGSGHPDPSEDDVRPPLLGLIRSTDQGRTWERLSLHGEADFHALEAVHGRVYGYDATSGTVMVSADGRDWDRRAQLPVHDLAVSPADPETVLATTPRALARSTDGGRTFAAVPGTPALSVLAWPAPDVLYGLAADGTVHHSSDGGRTWGARGQIGGEPEAVTVHEGLLYAAAAGRGVVVSADGGRTFRVRYAAP